MQPIAQHGDVASRLVLLRNWASASVHGCGPIGLSIAIVHGDELVLGEGFGLADIEDETESTAQTIYPLGAVGGLLTACAVLRLVDDGAIALDDPINAHVPGFAVKTRFIGARPITVRDLMLRTSGLPRDLVQGPVAPPEDGLESGAAARLLTSVRHEEVLYAPGTTWHYSNIDLALLDDVAARAAGAKYEDLVTRIVLEPLGMNETAPYSAPGAERTRHATGYAKRPAAAGYESRPADSSDHPAGAHPYRSTVLDIARFLSWQLRLLEARADEILRPDTLRLGHQVDRAITESTGQGLVFVSHDIGQRRLVGSDARLDGFECSAYVSPEERLGVVIMANSSNAQTSPGAQDSMTRKIFDWLGPCCVSASKGDEPIAFDPSLRRFEGAYEHGLNRDVYQVIDGKLMSYRPHLADPLVDALALRRRNDSTFVFAGAGERYLDGEQVVFDLPDSGEAKGLTIGATYWRRVESIAVST